jgi:hypothetical protein
MDADRLSADADATGLGMVALGVRFLLELGALGALAYWGFRTASGPWRWGLALAAPLVVAAVWGTFVAPKATRRMSDPWRLALELVIFGAAAGALALAGRPVLAVAFGAVVLVDEALVLALDLR